MNAALLTSFFPFFDATIFDEHALTMQIPAGARIKQATNFDECHHAGRLAVLGERDGGADEDIDQHKRDDSFAHTGLTTLLIQCYRKLVMTQLRMR